MIPRDICARDVCNTVTNQDMIVCSVKRPRLKMCMVFFVLTDLKEPHNSLTRDRIWFRTTPSNTP